MKKLETGNTSTLATFSRLLAVVALLAAGGCITRTGEYYQDTRARYVSPISTTFCRAGQIPVVGWFVFLPVGLVGCGLEIAVVNPVRDTLMLPIDVFQPYHGYYVRVIDESGFPVAGADVEIDGIGPSEMFWSDSVCFCTRYEVPKTSDFEKSITITDLKMPSHKSPEPADYIAYKVFRSDGGGKEYYGALTLESWFGTFYHIANPNPGDRSLEPCVEGIDWKHKVSK